MSLSYPQVTHQLSGNTAGAMALISSGTFVLAGGNNITLSQNANSVTISGGAGGGGGHSAGMSTLGNTIGDTGFGTDRLVLAGINNITLSGSTNAGSMTISISGPNPTAAAVTFGMSNLGNTASETGTVNQQFLVVGGAGIIGSQNVDGASATLSIVNSWSTATTASRVESANVIGANAGRFALEGHQHEGVYAAGVSNVGSTAGDTGTRPGRFVFAGSGALTVSQATAANSLQTIHFQAPEVATTVSSVGSANAVGAVNRFAREDHVHEGVYAAGVSNVGTTAGDTGSRPGRFVFAGSGGLTLSQATAANSLQTIHFQGPVSATTISNVTNANVIGTRGTRFAMEDHQHAGVPAIAAGSNTGNTAGNTGTQFGTWVFAGTNNVTVSGSTGAAGIHTAWFSAAAGGGGGVGAMAAGSNTGNTAGNTASQTGTWVIAGTDNITVSGSTGAGGVHTVWLSGGAGGGGGGYSAGMSTGGNTEGNTGIVTGRLVLAGGSNLTLSGSTNGGSMTITARGMGPPSISHWQNINPGQTGAAGLAALAIVHATLGVFPLVFNDVFPGNMTVSTIMFNMSGNITATASSSSHSSTFYYGLYTLANASELSLHKSGSIIVSMTAGTGNTGSWNGARWLSATAGTDFTLSQGSYWMAYMGRSHNISIPCNYMGIRHNISNARSGFLGAAALANNSLPHTPFAGFLSVSTTAMPNAIHRSNMSHTASGMAQFVPHVVFNNYAGIYG